MTSLILGGAVVVAVWGLVGCDRQGSRETAESESARETTARESNRAQKARPGQGDDSGEAEGEPGEEADESADIPQSLDDLPEGTNAVQNEMQLLNTAMQNTLTLIANDALQGIPAQIKNVHPARQLTEKAIEQDRYEPPVNADNMDRFLEFDERFHRDLRGLVEAAKKDDLQKATARYRDLVQGCTDCHTEFRFERRN